MISEIFIDRPRFATVISIVLTLAGLLALTRLPIAQFPDIVPPQVSVTASYPGAGADVVETTVAQPIESKVVGVDDMLYISSQSTGDGVVTINVVFKAGVDIDLNDKIFLNLDVKYIDIDTKVRLNGADLGTVHIDPIVYGAAYVMQF